VEQWLSLFESNNPAVRVRAAKVTLDHGQAAPLAVLLRILDELHDHGLGAKTVQVLKARCDDSLHVEMTARLRASPWFIRQVACVVLGELRDRSATPHLLATLSNDTHSMVRRAAAFALATVADPASGPAVLSHYESRAEDINVRMGLECALRALNVPFNKREW